MEGNVKALKGHTADIDTGIGGCMHHERKVDILKAPFLLHNDLSADRLLRRCPVDHDLIADPYRDPEVPEQLRSQTVPACDVRRHDRSLSARRTLPRIQRKVLLFPVHRQHGSVGRPAIPRSI